MHFILVKLNENLKLNICNFQEEFWKISSTVKFSLYVQKQLYSTKTIVYCQNRTQTDPPPSTRAEK